MTLDIAAEIKTAFDLASKRREAALNLNGAEWKEYQQIRRNFELLRQQENRKNLSLFTTRVEIARKALIDKAASKPRDFKARFAAADKFDAQALTRQARRQVTRQHQNNLARIDIRESEAIEALLERSVYRQKLAEKPRRDFARAADRRSGMDRREKRSRE